MPYIIVDSSTGNRPSVTGLSDVTWTSAVQWLATMELPIVVSRLYGLLKFIKENFTLGEFTPLKMINCGLCNVRKHR